MISGSLVAMVTPMLEDGSINYKKAEELIEFHIANQTDGIVILGTTGESSTMTFEEEQEYVRVCVGKADGRVPIIVGSGSNDTVTAIRNSQTFAALGADMLLVVTPYYNRANDAGMTRHFQMVADSVNVPIILYNIPGRTGCSISPAVVGELAQHPNIVGIKEASGDISYAIKLTQYLNEHFVMYSGNDDTIIPLLSIGATGVISVWANIMPQAVHDLVTLYLNGQHKEALAIQSGYLDLIDALFCETNPIPVKHALNALGYDVGPLRMPLCEMGEANHQHLLQMLEAHKEVWA